MFWTLVVSGFLAQGSVPAASMLSDAEVARLPPPARHVPESVRRHFQFPENPDCGVTALYFYLQINAVGASQDALRNMVNVKGRGASMRELQEAATRLGVPSEVLRLGPSVVRRLCMPVIARMKGTGGGSPDGHYVVLTCVGGDGVLCGVDGTTGSNVTFTPEAFERDFAGEVVAHRDALTWSQWLEPYAFWAIPGQVGAFLILLAGPYVRRPIRGESAKR